MESESHRFSTIHSDCSRTSKRVPYKFTASICMTLVSFSLLFHFSWADLCFCQRLLPLPPPSSSDIFTLVFVSPPPQQLLI
uniref:Transmembrane protein n=1 Tax=Caenorhabditis japonica TaxID=281687 RepID=A0A8R1IRX6_CAEJA